jgi:stage II sporulation protein AA (anti-sigma F factor antagonist)
MPTTPPFSAEVVTGTPDRVCVVALRGRLDLLAAEELESQLAALVQAGHRRFVVDLSALTYIGSIGIRVLLELAGRVKGQGLACLCSPTPLVKEVLDLVRISSVMRCYPTRADAIDAVTTV